VFTTSFLSATQLWFSVSCKFDFANRKLIPISDFQSVSCNHGDDTFLPSSTSVCPWWHWQPIRKIICNFISKTPCYHLLKNHVQLHYFKTITSTIHGKFDFANWKLIPITDFQSVGCNPGDDTHVFAVKNSPWADECWR